MPSKKIMIPFLIMLISSTNHNRIEPVCQQLIFEIFVNRLISPLASGDEVPGASGAELLSV